MRILIEWGKLAVVYFAKICFLPFHFFKVKKRILFTSLTGRNHMEYSCNLKYIYECLREKYDMEYEILWVFAEPEKYDFLKAEKVRLVRHFTLKAFYYLMTSQVVITSGAYVPWVPFRKRQVIIHTWHGGGAYKRIDTGNGYLKKITEKRNWQVGRNTSIFVTSSEAFSKYVIRGSFQFRGKILECGMPRNDMLVKHFTEAAEQKVKETYGVRGKRIILYAPTYRSGGAYNKLNMRKLVRYMEHITNDTWVCLYRLHRYETGESAGEKACAGIIDANGYPDMQELLAAADMLITDYSSSIWDYSFLERPCYLYVPDLEIYRKNRGFYEEIDSWQFPYAQNEEQLYKIISEIEVIDWKNRMDMHHRMLGSCETGNAAEIVTECIKRVCEHGVTAYTEE